MSSTILINRCCEGCCTLEVLASCVHCDGSGVPCVLPGVCVPTSYITPDVYGRFFVNPNFPPNPPLCYTRDSTMVVHAPTTESCSGVTYSFSSATVITRCENSPLSAVLWTSPDITVEIPDPCCLDCLITVILNYKSGNCTSDRFVVAGGDGELTDPGNPFGEGPFPGNIIGPYPLVIMPADTRTGENVIYDGSWWWPGLTPSALQEQQLVSFLPAVRMSAVRQIGIEHAWPNLPIMQEFTHGFTAEVVVVRPCGTGEACEQECQPGSTGVGKGLQFTIVNLIAECWYRDEVTGHIGWRFEFCDAI